MNAYLPQNRGDIYIFIFGKSYHRNSPVHDEREKCTSFMFPTVRAVHSFREGGKKEFALLTSETPPCSPFKTIEIVTLPS